VLKTVEQQSVSVVLQPKVVDDRSSVPFETNPVGGADLVHMSLSGTLIEDQATQTGALAGEAPFAFHGTADGGIATFSAGSAEPLVLTIQVIPVAAITEVASSLDESWTLREPEGTYELVRTFVYANQVRIFGPACAWGEIDPSITLNGSGAATQLSFGLPESNSVFILHKDGSFPVTCTINGIGRTVVLHREPR
jgi:hypothetical protein